MKQEKRVSTTIEQYDGEWPPEDAAGFIAWFQKQLNDVPPEFRSTARIALGSLTRYDDDYATIKISYTRMETDEEEAERENRAAATAAQLQAHELRMLASLQAKYGKSAT